MTPRLLSHFFSLTGESPIKTRCIDDRLSFKRARHRQKKKYLRELLCHRQEVLSGMKIFLSESIVLHLVFWVSSFVVLFWGVWVCFVSTLEDI